MKINIFFYLFIFLLLGGCRNADTYKHNRLIEFLSVEPLDMKYPSRFEGLFIFLDSENINKKRMTFPREIKAEYIEKKYKFKYNRYLEKVLNGKIHIKESIECFKLNEEITDNYEKMNIECFISHYCKKVGTRFQLSNKTIDEDMALSILYYLFLNEYYSTQSDYTGFYSVFKIESI